MSTIYERCWAMTIFILISEFHVPHGTKYSSQACMFFSGSIKAGKIFENQIFACAYGINKDGDTNSFLTCGDHDSVWLNKGRIKKQQMAAPRSWSFPSSFSVDDEMSLQSHINHIFYLDFGLIFPLFGIKLNHVAICISISLTYNSHESNLDSKLLILTSHGSCIWEMYGNWS